MLRTRDASTTGALRPTPHYIYIISILIFLQGFIDYEY